MKIVSWKAHVQSSTGALYELLMEMVMESVSPKDGVAMQLSSIASACLLSLVVALGDTGKMLSALAAMLIAPSCLSESTLKVRTSVLTADWSGSI